MDRNRGPGGRLFSVKKARLLEKRKLFLNKGRNNSIASEPSTYAPLNHNFNIGRRIIDVNFFGQQFDQGCDQCKYKFEFSDIVNETKFGFASNFHFVCRKCGITTRIATSSIQSDTRQSKSRRLPFTVNVKAALAMVHAGVGETHLNAIFSTMGLPTISATALKKRERAIGPVIERTARESCHRATLEEILLTCSGDNQQSQQINGSRIFDNTLSILEECEENYHEDSVLNIEDEMSTVQLVGHDPARTNLIDIHIDECYRYKNKQDDIKCPRDQSSGSSGATHPPDSQISFDDALALLEESETDDTRDTLSIAGDNSKCFPDTTTVSSESMHTIESADNKRQNNYMIEGLPDAQDEEISEVTNTPSDFELSTRSTADQPLASSCDRDQDEPNPVNIAISQDAAWPKRGKGMNSLSGWANIIGTKTKKCLDFGTRNKSCKICSSNRKLGITIPPHDCRCNWKQSAKAMEPSIQVELHQKASNRGVKYAKIIGDEDSSSIKHIRDQVNHDVEKYSDIHHIKRSLYRKLVELHTTNKSLTEKVRYDFLKNFTYAVHQNNNKSESEMKTALTSIPEHMFGNHQLCGSWCGYARDPNNYKHSNLPFGKDLTDQPLKQKLKDLISHFIKNPKKLMTSGSTQSNESLNNVAWSKAPKTRNYTASESFDYRCAAAVLQFNEGVNYVNGVNDNLGLSPRKETKEFTNRRDTKRKYHKLYKSERKNKRRRIELKRERKTGDHISDIKLGITYKTECLLSASEEINLDTEIITDPDLKRELVSSEIIDDCLHVFIDLEANKLGYQAEIVQLAACTKESDFNRFILPKTTIATKATEITGITVSAVNGQKRLFKNGVMLDTVPIDTALQDFIEWLAKMATPIIIIAHNGKKFDFPILCRHLKEANLFERANDVITGLADSLPVARHYFRDLHSYKLAAIHEHVFSEESFDEHNALADAHAVMRIFQRIPKRYLYTETERFKSYAYIVLKRIEVRSDISDLRTQLTKDGKCILSNRIAEKIVMSGITYDTMLLAHRRDSESGIRAILSEKINGTSRVTNRIKIINNLIDFYNTLN